MTATAHYRSENAGNGVYFKKHITYKNVKRIIKILLIGVRRFIITFRAFLDFFQTIVYLPSILPKDKQEEWNFIQ